jgi:sec-independent protein translocase protein TatB
VFNFQGSELIIILLLALVVLGPEKLPDAMRKLGNLYGELKKMSNGFQQEFRAALDEPVREVRETANMLRDSADFRKLADGERAEKPKSAEMAPADPASTTAAPTADVPFSSNGHAEPAAGHDEADDEASDFDADDPVLDDAGPGGLVSAPPAMPQPRPPAGPVVTGAPPAPSATPPPPPPPPPPPAPPPPSSSSSSPPPPASPAPEPGVTSEVRSE